MRTRRLIAAAIALGALAAQAELRVEISATDPPSPAALARDEPMRLRIEYAGAEQTSLWARPYYRGEAVKRAKTNPSRKHTGSGTALGWFSLDAADSVDEVRIRAGGGTPYRETEVLRFPVDVRGTGVPGEHRPRASWAESLVQENDARHRAERAEERARPASLVDMLIGTGFAAAVVGLFVAGIAGPAWALWKWRGWWRVLGGLPLAAMAFVIGRVVVDTAADPTSHNLWPFEILMAGGAGIVLLAVLAVARRVVRPR